MPKLFTRRRVVRLVMVLVVAVGAYLVYLRWPTILGWFDNERVNQAAVDVLKKAPLPVAAPAAATEGWPQWRGPNRDGVAPAGPFHVDWKAKPPKEIWSVACGGGYSSLAVVGGRVYGHDYRDGRERLFALDAETGKTVWEFAEAVNYSAMTQGYATGPRATPTVHQGRVYAVGATGRFVCVEPPNGGTTEARLVWSHDFVGEFDASVPGWGVSCSPLVDGDVVIVQPGGRKGSVAAFDLATGALRWSAGKEPSGYSSPVAATLGGVRQVVAVTGKSVLGIRPKDGQVLWTYSWVTQHDANIATPVVVGDYVFVSSSYSKGCALLRVEAAGDGAEATEVYYRKNRVMRNHQNTCVVRDGYLYGFDNERLKCVNLRTGEAMPSWEADLRLEKGNLILADKYLLGLTESGKLFLADADHLGYKLRGMTEPVFNGRECWATPVLLDGRLYVRGPDGVKCFDVR